MSVIRAWRHRWRIILVIVVIPVLLGVAAWQGVAVMRAHAIQAPGTRKYANLEYARVNGRAIRLDLYVPLNVQAKYPVIVWIHGGSWTERTKDEVNPAFGLTPGRYAIAAIDFRQSTQAPFPAQIHDCKAAIRWLRAHAAEYRLDPDHIAVWGDSSGGHLAALLGVSGDVAELEGNEGNAGFSSRVQCVVDCYGPTDLVEAVEMPEDAQNIQIRAVVTRLLGGDEVQKAAQASPVTYVSPDDPPFFILHGDQDQIIPVEQSRELDTALRAAGVSSQLTVVPGEGHNLRFVYAAERLDAVQRFLDASLAR